ncbi:MAG TPA: ABC transporter ATP-binding protein [Rhodocyclaceae bacterium]|nr:ABC transporter ATP-binding protein [Rhodocyclaceae bacterium]
MLHIRDLDINIGGCMLCRGVRFNLAAGRSLAILGRNGAGKSTLLATLAGLRPASGHVDLAGRALHAYAPRELARFRAWCAQQQSDAFSATVLQTALIGRHPHLDRWASESDTDVTLAMQALSRVGIAHMAAHEVHTLSGGERQLLALATALLQSPQIYLLDEPLSHLDLNHAMTCLRVLDEEKRQGRAIVAVLHEPNLALRRFDEAMLMFDDGTWLHGASADVITAANLQKLYGHPLRALQDNGAQWFIPE